MEPDLVQLQEAVDMKQEQENTNEFLVTKEEPVDVALIDIKEEAESYIEIKEEQLECDVKLEDSDPVSEHLPSCTSSDMMHTISTLSSHQKLHISDPLFSQSDEETDQVADIEKDNGSEEPACHSCSICNKLFTVIDSLKAHMYTHKGYWPYRCKICNRPFANYEILKEHKHKLLDEESYVCTICNKSFNRRDGLKVHMRVHTDQRPYTCQICNKSFAVNYYLKIHMRSHTDQRPYTCQICHKSFKVNWYLKSHMLTHTGQRPYTCEICNKSFRMKSFLKNHTRLHTGERPYSCEMCNKSYTRLMNLKKHLLRVHSHKRQKQVKVLTNDLERRST